MPKRRSVLNRLLTQLTVFCLAVLAAGFAWQNWSRRHTKTDLPLMATASRSALRVIVTERGNLESTKTVDGICEVPGRENKIIFIVAEGAEVKKGDVVVRFDTAEIDKDIAAQLIKVSQAEGKVNTTRQEVDIESNKGESDVADAGLQLKLADLDLRKYEQGDYQVELNELQGKIALALKEQIKAKEDVEHFRTLVKKGFRSPEQLGAKEQALAEFEFYLKRDQEKLRVLKEYDYQRKVTEFTGKAEQAAKKLHRSKATAKAGLAKATSEHNAAKAALTLENEQLKSLNGYKEKCVITASQDGVVAYANEYYYDSGRQIREGAMVYSRQKIFSLPDMSAMQVKVNVHESVVKKVEVGQKAEVRVDAFSQHVLEGTVTSVSPLADSTRSWMRGGVKEYTTIIKLDRMPNLELKPGMTAEVKIRVNELSDCLIVPVQSVTEHEGQHYAYVYNGEAFDRREVTVGDNNEKMIQIVQGLAEGDQVALDARRRGIADFDKTGIGAVEKKESPGNAAPTATVGQSS